MASKEDYPDLQDVSIPVHLTGGRIIVLISLQRRVILNLLGGSEKCIGIIIVLILSVALEILYFMIKTQAYQLSVADMRMLKILFPQKFSR